jgi:multidrug efflux pump subunit AcrB
MFSKFFIERPVLANVIAILIVVLGVVALFILPVAQYPDVVPPTVQVVTRYPGASARTVVDTVALPIEQQVNGVEGMLYMQSYAASDGSYTLTVTFEIGVNLDYAQILVQNRVSAAMSSLPQSVQAQGVVDRHPTDRHPDLAGRPLRRPLSGKLRHHQPEGRHCPPAGRRQRDRVRRRAICHAGLA